MTPGLWALRTSVALSRLDHVVVAAVRGLDAIDVLDRIAPKNLYLRDGEVLQTLFLREDGTVLADVLAVSDDQDFLLLVEGMEPEAVREHLLAHVGAGEDATVDLLTDSARCIGVDGPFAWELLVRKIGAEVVALPYLHAVALDDGTIVVRAGKTGEFGYVLVSAVERVEHHVDELVRIGQSLDLVWADCVDLDTAAVENFFFCPRVPGLSRLTLPQLQLQWRVSPDKEGYTGSAAVIAAMEREPSDRLTYTSTDREVEANAVLTVEGQAVGSVLASIESPTTGAWVTLALVRSDQAHPGQVFCAGDVTLHSVSPPLVDNHSLYVDPQRHTYATRGDAGLPELS